MNWKAGVSQARHLSMGTPTQVSLLKPKYSTGLLHALKQSSTLTLLSVDSAKTNVQP